MFDYVSVGLLALVLIGFGALTAWAWRARRLWVRIIGGIPAGLLTLAAGAALTMALIGYARINATQPNQVRQFVVASTPQQIAHGEKFARACAGCHSPNNQLPLTGNNFMPGAPFGTFYAQNLTQAHFKDWSDGEIIRAIREGVGRNGRSLMIMPSNAFHAMSDEDVQALVAYLRSQPADAPTTPPNNFNAFGAIMFGLLNNVQTVQPPITSVIAAPPAGPTAEYGLYLTRVGGCMDCHGQNLAGSKTPDSGAIAPSLVAVAKSWSEADFIKTLRTGVTPEGKALSKDMPWKEYEKLSDDDFRAIFAHLAAAK